MRHSFVKISALEKINHSRNLLNGNGLLCLRGSMRKYEQCEIAVVFLAFLRFFTFFLAIKNSTRVQEALRNYPLNWLRRHNIHMVIPV
jgi:hypothetical protein